jgi:peptidoglycan/LPS O-acetylase OafA/YrhL
MGCHTHTRGFLGGLLGVDVFFVLSGFLITSLLVREWEGTSTLSLRLFYGRRALRLFPALAVAILFAVVLAQTGHAQAATGTVSGVPFVVLYVGDLARAFGWGQLGTLAHTWSLAVEEQFYLLWPPLLLLLLRRKTTYRSLALLLLGLALMEALFRAVLVLKGGNLAAISASPFTRSDGLAIGCAVALLLTARGQKPFTVTAGRLLRAATVVGVAATVWAVMRGSNANPATFELGIPIAILAAAAAVVTTVGGCWPALTAVLEIPPLRWIGQRSYGIYLYHFPIFYALYTESAHPRNKLLAMGVSIAVAAVSYRLIESPALRLKDRLRPAAVLAVP